MSIDRRLRKLSGENTVMRRELERRGYGSADIDRLLADAREAPALGTRADPFAFEPGEVGHGHDGGRGEQLDGVPEPEAEAAPAEPAEPPNLLTRQGRAQAMQAYNAALVAGRIPHK